jgi:transcriptional regulator with XRE-family HTH domain
MADVELEPLLPAAGPMEGPLEPPAAVGPALISRRSALNLSQAELARRAGIRVETLNRIERGHTTPDFTTLRKLTVALKDFAAAKSRSRTRRTAKMEVNR